MEKTETFGALTAVNALVADEGWTDNTAVALLCEFIDAHNMHEELFEWLLARAAEDREAGDTDAHT